MSQGGGQLNPGPLADAIKRDFGSLDELKKVFNAQTAAIQGSGWGWVGYNAKTQKLEFVPTANQDPLLCASESLSFPSEYNHTDFDLGDM